MQSEKNLMNHLNSVSQKVKSSLEKSGHKSKEAERLTAKLMTKYINVLVEADIDERKKMQQWMERFIEE
ncbi:hypothetical protein EWH99_10830 [Sporolactobacillus sp. THM7-7]|nr:hypothetical protein EWH99_10830 [Sporolactobacillus sp. THM7-7]